ncbi:hypothetical protein HID58_010557 [Brassica napus]|uniref:(S)-ureidoglycine aminohydrolase cupin domain-containing protein n=2 Tax=Brassica TaxID=3705 RepID=A0A3P6A920_BRACM|nr:uncharacterized protein BNAA03G24310D isoform X2 [Brassica napus]KAH0933440.1 hypothetical protein HID58_010557 [Brassica napus]CAF2125092.1 unnamed protein product [Brassica napus]CAG7881555.1 unnamed protein product [Brassica rapa]VDC80871.1 unnamed protein product [Brassica rapa]
MEPNCDSVFAPAIPTDIHGVKILRKPSDAKLVELGVASWPVWESIPRKFPWKFKKTETMYFLEGKLKVTIDEQQKEEKEVAFELTAGDLVVIPKGMTVVVDVTEAVKKHYYRDSEIVKYESPSKA